MTCFIAIAFRREEQRKPVVAALKDVPQSLLDANHTVLNGDPSSVDAPLREIVRCLRSDVLRGYVMTQSIHRGGLAIPMTPFTQAVAVSYQYAEHAIQMALTSMYIYDANVEALDGDLPMPDRPEPVSPARKQFLKDIEPLYAQ